MSVSNPGRAADGTVSDEAAHDSAASGTTIADGTASANVADSAAGEPATAPRLNVVGRVESWLLDGKRAQYGTSILHQPVPSRLYLTNFQLTSHYQVSDGLLPKNLQQVPTNAYTGADWLDKLKKDLPDNGSAADAAATTQFIKDETAMTSMVSSVARARWGDSVTEVQFKILTTPIKPYPVRNDASYQVKTTEFDGGWRQSVRVPDIDLAAIAAMYGEQAVAQNVSK
ncbi:MAG TPA: DUF5819 family protein [Micrococcaceae bacterium]